MFKRDYLRGPIWGVHSLTLIISCLELIYSGLAMWQTKSTLSFPLEDKHVVNEHHVKRKSHDATQKKCPHVVYFDVPCHVIDLKQTRGIKNVTLKAAKKIVGVSVYWELKSNIEIRRPYTWSS